MTDEVSLISDVLYNTIVSPYCYSCRYNDCDSNRCDDCRRKSMMWDISREEAECIAAIICAKLNIATHS